MPLIGSEYPVDTVGTIQVICFKFPLNTISYFFEIGWPPIAKFGFYQSLLEPLMNDILNDPIDIELPAWCAL